MNIAFYYTNQKISNVDCRNVDSGNPGIGGTYYAMLLLTFMLSQKNLPQYHFFLFAESVALLPRFIQVVETTDLIQLSENLQKHSIDILVVNKIGTNTLDKAFFKAIKNNEIKIVVWAHCFIPYLTLCRYAKNHKIAKIVAVGKEQLYTWCDHSAFSKSTFIYNICHYPPVTLTPFSQRKNRVVYIGSIVPLKGLHLLTTVWREIKGQIPDAELYVIGSGRLYDSKGKVGKFGIAEYFYERKILKPILNQNGEIDSSVHFLGILGKEKVDILNSAKVGVPNPSGLTETFGFTAVEMQLAGCLVTTIKCPGYLDTVWGDDNILYENPKLLANSIVRLLKCKEYNQNQAIQFIQKEFSPECIVEQWLSLFEEIHDKQKPRFIDIIPKYKPSLLKKKNRTLQKFLPFLPSLMLYDAINTNMKYIIDKLLDFPTTVEKIYYRYLKR